jgi:hypothetical protein
MKVYDAGHIYALQSLDGGGPEILNFVKRMGQGYPGNKSMHPGTIIQEVLRAICNRLDYVNNQIPCRDNRKAKRAIQTAIWYLEHRAAERHGRKLKANFWEDGINLLPVCAKCGHIECPGCNR